MIHGEINVPVDEHFTVVDKQNNFISGIDSTEFSVFVYDPTNNEISSSINGFFTELGNGNYKYTFTPTLSGIWYVVVIHSQYFPWGKTDDVKVDERSLKEIYDTVIRVLGLTHENIYIDETVYGDAGSLISARVRIYDSSVNVGTNSGVIERYKIEADELECGKFSWWKQVKI